MTDLSNLTYSSLQTAVGDWLARADLATNIPDFITLFEAEANRTLRTRQMETTTLLYPFVNRTVDQTSISQTWYITNVTAAGTSLGIRLFVVVDWDFEAEGVQPADADDTESLAVGDKVVVANILGTTEANGTWIISAVGVGYVDLDQSVFKNAYISGGVLSRPLGQTALPPDYLAWRRVSWTGTPNRELEYVQPSILRTYHPIINNADLVSNSDFPSMFTIEGNNIIVRPIDPNGIEFSYYQRIPSLASQGSTGTNWLLTIHPDLYLFGAMTEGYVFQKDWDQAGMWKQRRDDIMERIRSFDQKTRGPSAIRPAMVGRIP